MNSLRAVAAGALVGLVAAGATLGVTTERGSAAALDVDGGVLQVFVIDAPALPDVPLTAHPVATVGVPLGAADAALHSAEAHPPAGSTPKPTDDLPATSADDLPGKSADGPSTKPAPEPVEPPAEPVEEPEADCAPENPTVDGSACAPRR